MTVFLRMLTIASLDKHLSDTLNAIDTVGCLDKTCMNEFTLVWVVGYK